jgi:hypothetical protein
VSAHFFGALEDAGVGVMSAAASETRVAAVCEDTAVPKAVTAIHDAFSLDRFEQEPTVRELAVLSAAGSGCSEPLRSSG